MSDLVRLVARVWRRVSQEHPDTLRESDGDTSRGWSDLMDNADMVVKERVKELMEEYEQLSTILDEDECPDWTTFVSICGKIITNCFCLRSDR